jgi:hypothetical protein
MMMSDVWPERVGIYVDQLEQTALTIELILDQTQLESSGGDSAKVQESTVNLEQSLVELEQKIAEREELLCDPEAPVQGVTLAEKLRGTGRDQDAQLARRCEQIAGLIGSTHHRAISIFVCHYHLSELSTELVRLMVGASLPATYGAGNEASTPPGGGLFNESA